MKKVLLITFLGIVFTAGAIKAETIPADTTIVIEGKRIEVKESDDRVKVRVYEIAENDDLVENEMVFEGHYKDGKSYERRKHSFNITLPLWKRGFDPHWGGFGMGFANFADGDLHINDIDGVTLRSGNSLEYNLNFLEKSFLLSKQSNFAIVTGMGMRWSRYRVNNSQYFKEIEGVTGLLPAPEGVTFSKSKLNITSLTIPLLLEWQNRSKKSEQFFVSAGVVGVIKTASSSRIAYKDANGKKQAEKVDSGMNLRPVTMDFLLQAGYSWVGVYAKYSPMGLFEGGKGPKVHPVSIGLHLHW